MEAAITVRKSIAGSIIISVEARPPGGMFRDKKSFCLDQGIGVAPAPTK